MSANLSFNPYKSTTGQGLFAGASADGLVQGVAYPDPATRFALRTGILSNAETIPMWGGLAIYENVPDGYTAPSVSLGDIGGRAPALGVSVGRATALTGASAYAGFSVFDQAYGMVITPDSRVPMIGSGGQVMTYRKGSGARIAVKCDPSLIGLQGGPIGANVSWDWVNGLLVPYLGTLTISSGTYVTGTGVVTLTMSAPITFSPGDAVVVSGLTGTGAFAALDGTFTALDGTTGSTVVYNAGAGHGAATITGGSLTLGSGASEALPVSVLDVQIGGCMTVDYDAATNTANWDYDGNAAVIQL